MYGAVKALKGTDRYSLVMPNMLNCSFDYELSVLAIMTFYVPGKNTTTSNLGTCQSIGAPKLYMYMLSQRRKVFRPKVQ